MSSIKSGVSPANAGLTPDLIEVIFSTKTKESAFINSFLSGTPVNVFITNRGTTTPNLQILGIHQCATILGNWLSDISRTANGM